GVLDLYVQRPELGLRVRDDLRILDRYQPRVDALGETAARHRVVHETPRDVRLPHRAARPGRVFGREDVADPQLLTEAEQQRGRTRGVRIGQLGDVGRAHEDLGLREPAPHLVVAVQGLGEAEADGLEDRVHDVADRPALERFDVALQRVQPRLEV